MTKNGKAWVVGGSVLAVGIAVLERTAAGRRLSRRMARRITRVARYEAGRLEGTRYRLRGGAPDPGATDAVLADRVRSMLGPIEQRLDVPHVLVSACGHDVALHGDVGSDGDAETIVAAVAAVPGVGRVESHLHVGMGAGDTRPSEGRARRPQSAALRRLVSAAHGGGAPRGTEQSAVRSVLSTFAGALPPGERRHVVGHLPADVRALVSEAAVAHAPVRRIDDFAVTALPTLPPDDRRSVVESVLGALRELVPEEDVDVSAVLAEELRHLWKTAVPL